MSSDIYPPLNKEERRAFTQTAWYHDCGHHGWVCRYEETVLELEKENERLRKDLKASKRIEWDFLYDEDHFPTKGAWENYKSNNREVQFRSHLMKLLYSALDAGATKEELLEGLIYWTREVALDW